MLALGSLAFASPWLLAALPPCPVIWWLLRVPPPAPRRIAFPAITLLLGLRPREETPARTPWWLILLRTVLAASVGFSLWRARVTPRAGRVGDSGAGASVAQSASPAGRRRPGGAGDRRRLDVGARLE